MDVNKVKSSLMFVCSFTEISIKPALSFSAAMYPSSEDTSLDSERSILFPHMNIEIFSQTIYSTLSFHSPICSNELLLVTS